MAGYNFQLKLVSYYLHIPLLLWIQQLQSWKIALVRNPFHWITSAWDWIKSIDGLTFHIHYYFEGQRSFAFEWNELEPGWYHGGADHIIGKVWGWGWEFGMWRTESYLLRIIWHNQEEEKEICWSLTFIITPSHYLVQFLRFVSLSCSDLKYNVWFSWLEIISCILYVQTKSSKKNLIY